MNFKDIFHTDLLQEVENSGYIKKFNAGDVIMDMNSYVRSIPIVISGTIKVMRTDSDGKELLLYYIKPGESCIVSILAGINQETGKIKTIIEDAAEVIMLPADKAREWIRKYPEWSDFIFHLYQKRFEELLDVVNAVAFQKIDTRIMHLLKQKIQLYNSNEVKVTHQQLADELGITREATSRVLKQLENDGHIVLERNKISVL